MPALPLAVSARSAQSPALPGRRFQALPAPSVVMCDLDGTLVDSMPILAELATEVMERIYVMPRSLARELYLTTCGLPFIKQLDVLFPGDARNVPASAAFEALKPERCRGLRIAADTTVALARLRDMGARVVVSSNNGTANVEAFARSSLFSFDLALGFGAGLAKGRPHVDRVIREYGVGRQEILFVGDSLHDGEIAAEEGIPFVGVIGTFSRERFMLRFPDVPIVQRFSDLPDLF